MSRLLLFFAFLVAWFAAAHLIYWFVNFQWSWMSEWEPDSRAILLGLGAYSCVFLTALRPWRHK